MKKHTLALSIATALLSSASFAQEKDIWMGGFAEYYYADKDKFEFTPQDRIDWGWGLEIGERFNESWAGRFEYARIDLESYEGQESIDGYRFGFDAMYFPFQSNTYVFAGLKHQSLDKGYGLGNVGIGHHWSVSEKWKVITEVAAYHDFGQSHKDYSAKIGLAYQFGSSGTSSVKPVKAMQPSEVVNADSDNDGVVDNRDRCPNTATGIRVDANGCAMPVDSDRDGVVDNKDKCPNTPRTDKTDAQGCTLFKETQDSIALEINFAQNSSEVTDPNASDLRRFADFMKKYPDVTAMIEGHSSAPGEADYNQWLSEKRANAVVQVLINQYGVSSQRLSAVGYGESRLLDTADNEAAHRTNRRIEAKLVVNKREKVLK